MEKHLVHVEDKNLSILKRTNILMKVSQKILSTIVDYRPYLNVGHTSWVMSLHICPNDKYLLSGGLEGTLILWDINSGRKIRTFRGHVWNNYSIHFSQNRLNILSVCKDKNLVIWDFFSEEIVQTLDKVLMGPKRPLGQYQVSFGTDFVNFTPDGQHAFVGGGLGQIRMYNIATGQVIRTFDYVLSEDVRSATISHDGKFIIFLYSDGGIKLWDIELWKEDNRLNDVYPVSSVIFSPDDKYILYFYEFDFDKVVKLHEMKSGKLLKNFEGHEFEIKGMAFTSDSKYVLSSSIDTTSRLWDIETGETIRIFQEPTGYAHPIKVSANSQYAYSGNIFSMINMWNVSNSELIHTFKGDANSLYSVSYSSDGRYALTGGNNKIIHLWDINSGKLIRTYVGHTETINAVTFSFDDLYILSGSSDKTLKLWSVANGMEINSFKGHLEAVTAIDISMDGQYALSGSEDGMVILWDIYSGREVRHYKKHSSSITSVRFSPAGKVMLSADFESIIVMDIEKDVELNSFSSVVENCNSTKLAVFSPNGRYILSSNLSLRDLETGKNIRTKFSVSNTALEYSPDGIFAAGGKYGGEIVLYNVEDATQIQTFKGHDCNVTSVSFSPDGKNLLSCSMDGAMKLWDIKTNKEIISYTTFDDGEWASITPNGYFNCSDSAKKHVNILTGPKTVMEIDDDSFIKYYCPVDLVSAALKG